MQPVLGDVIDELPNVGIVGVELRELAVVPPAGIVRRALSVEGIERVVDDVEPVHVGRLRSVLHDVIELQKTPAGVVEDTVENNADATNVGSLQHLTKGSVTAEEGIHAVVIVGVIAVVGGGGEDGVEVEGIDAQRFQVVEVLLDPEQIPPLEAAHRRWCVPRLEIIGLRHPFTKSEAIRKDLIEDGVFNPIRGTNGHV